MKVRNIGAMRDPAEVRNAPLELKVPRKCIKIRLMIFWGMVGWFSAPFSK